MYGFRRGSRGEVAGICSDMRGSGMVFSHPGSEATCPVIEAGLLTTRFALLLSDERMVLEDVWMGL